MNHFFTCNETIGQLFLYVLFLHIIYKYVCVSVRAESTLSSTTSVPVYDNVEHTLAVSTVVYSY